MSFVREVWYVNSPVEDLTVKVRLTGQTTDDDWYYLEILELDGTGQPSPTGYPLSLDHSRPFRNIGEVKFSDNGSTIVAVEIDGTVIAWRKGSTGKFDDPGHLLYVGGPIHGLEVEESGAAFSVCRHCKDPKFWEHDTSRGKFVEQSAKNTRSAVATAEGEIRSGE